MAGGKRKRSGRRPPVGRLLALGGLVLLGFLYYRPLTSYLETKKALEQRAAEVRALEQQHRVLERRLARSGSQLALVRKARELSLVKPGERLFIVKGIPEWRQRRHARDKQPR
jgi:cell division protein FtsB